MNTWNVEKVKEELPDVKVKFNNKVSLWRVRGRKNQFAGLYDPSTNIGIEAAWETVVHVLNHDTAIIGK